MQMYQNIVTVDPKDLSFPRNISTQAIDLIKKLLHKDPK
jgi:hypothetical protein